MKLVHIKPGIVYIESRSYPTELYMVLDPEMRYRRDSYDRDGRLGRRYRPATPGFKAATHILVLSAMRGGTVESSPDAARGYTLDDYNAGVRPPTGWSVDVVTPAQFGKPYAVWLVEQTEAANKRVEYKAKAEREEAENRQTAEAMVAMLSGMGVEAKAVKTSYGSTTFNVVIGADQHDNLVSYVNQPHGWR